MSAPFDAAPEPNFNPQQADNSVSDDQLKQGDLDDIKQENIVDPNHKETRGRGSNDAYQQERGLDKAVDSVLEGTQGGGST